MRDLFEAFDVSPEEAPRDLFESFGILPKEAFKPPLTRDGFLNNAANFRDASIMDDGPVNNASDLPKAHLEIGARVAERVFGNKMQTDDPRWEEPTSKVGPTPQIEPSFGDVPSDLALRELKSLVMPQAYVNTARDLASGVLKIGPTAFKSVGDISQMLTAGHVGDGLSRDMENGMAAIDQVIGSEGLNRQKAAFNQVMLDPNKGVSDLAKSALMNPAASVDAGITTVGSMLLPAGAAGTAANVYKGADAAKKALIATRAAIGTGAAMNAADTFTSIESKNLSDKYQGAALSAAASLLAGKVTGGGIDGAIARKISGDPQVKRVLGRVLGTVLPAGKEATQEGIEELGGILGEAWGDDKELSGNQIAKRAGYAGALGAVTGGAFGAVEAHGERQRTQAEANAEVDRRNAEARREYEALLAEVSAPVPAQMGQDLPASNEIKQPPHPNPPPQGEREILSPQGAVSQAQNSSAMPSAKELLDDQKMVSEAARYQHAERRLQALEEARDGVADYSVEDQEGNSFVQRGIPARALSPVEQVELAFLQENQHNQGALAEAYWQGEDGRFSFQAEEGQDLGRILPQEQGLKQAANLPVTQQAEASANSNLPSENAITNSVNEKPSAAEFLGLRDKQMPQSTGQAVPVFKSLAVTDSDIPRSSSPTGSSRIVTKSAPIMRRDDLVGAIMRVTGGRGISSDLALTLTGDTANRATKLRGLFQKEGQQDLGDLAMLLREEEGYDVQDASHLEALVRDAAHGDVAKSMSRQEADLERALEKEERDRLRREAKKYGVRHVAQKLSDVAAKVGKIKEERLMKAVGLLKGRALRFYTKALELAERTISAEEVDDIWEKNAQDFEGVPDFDTDRHFLNAVTRDLKERVKEARIFERAMAEANEHYSEKIHDNQESARTLRDTYDGQIARDGWDGLRDDGGRGASPDRGDGRGEISDRSPQKTYRERWQGVEPDWIENPDWEEKDFTLNGQTNEEASAEAKSRTKDEGALTKAQIDRERDGVPFTLTGQSQAKPQGVQGDMFSFDGKPSATLKKRDVSPETITIDGAERPTKNSNGKPIHPTEEGIRNFWKWFGDSKVVDGKGRPIAVTHDTDQNFDIFDVKKARQNADVPGFFFFPQGNEDAAYKTYGKNRISAYLSLKNPFVGAVDISMDGIGAKESLIKKGYDGIICLEDDGSPAEYIAFEPSQIKSATGNTGAFDGKNPSILYSRSENGGVPESEWLSTGEIVQVVEQLIEPFQATKIPVRIVDLTSDATKVDGGGLVASGITNGGEIYLVREGISSTADVAKTLWHEMLHFGIRRFMTKPQYINAMDHLYQSDDWVKYKADIWTKSEDAKALREQGESNAYIQARGVDEALADLAEIIKAHPSGHERNDLVNRTLRKIYEWIAKLAEHFGNPHAAKEWRSYAAGKDARDLVTSIFSRLEEGAEPETKSTRWHTSDPAFSLASLASRVSKENTANQEPPRRPLNPNSPQDAVKEKASKAQEKWDSFLYTLQDNKIDLKRLQGAISDQGEIIKDAHDAYTNEEVFLSRLSNRELDYRRGEVLPLIAKINNSGLGLEKIESYLHALHANERNAEMAVRNPNASGIETKLSEAIAAHEATLEKLSKAKDEKTKRELENEANRAEAQVRKWRKAEAFKGTEEDRLALSGMSDQESDRVLKSFSPDDLKKLSILADMVDEMQAKTRATYVEYGLETQETVDAWKNQYGFYVPLHRDDAHPLAMGNGQGVGFSVSGSAAKKATGSNAEVTNILTHVFMARHAALARGEKNRVAIAHYQLLKAHPDDDF